MVAGGVRRRKGPSDPQAITAARAQRLAEARVAEQAQARAQARAERNDPGQWGVSAEIFYLPTANDVDLVRDDRGKVLAARRSDPFDLLLAAGGLSDDQHRAARRLFRDWCLRAGVRDRDHLVLEKIDGGRPDPSAMVTDGMVDAGRRVARALKGDPDRGLPGVGPVNAQLLEALISPMVDDARVIAWRGVVERVTGERERHVQGALVRQACEALRLVYRETDAAPERGRRQDAPSQSGRVA